LVTIQTYIHEEDYQALKSIAEREERSMSSTIRRILLAHLRRQKDAKGQTTAHRAVAGR
jgi:hypothetical protein